MEDESNNGNGSDQEMELDDLMNEEDGMSFDDDEEAALALDDVNGGSCDEKKATAGGQGQGDEFTSEEEEEEEWEDVSDGAAEYFELNFKSGVQSASKIHEEGLTITISEPGPSSGNRKNPMEVYAKRMENLANRAKQLELHKASLASLFATGLMYNELINSTDVLNMALEIFAPKKFVNRTSLSYLTSAIDWFKKEHRVNELTVLGDPNASSLIAPKYLEGLILEGLTKKVTERVFVYYCMFIAYFRAVGADARLVLSLQPIPKSTGGGPKPMLSTLTEASATPDPPAPKKRKVESEKNVSDPCPKPKENGNTGREMVPSNHGRSGVTTNIIPPGRRKYNAWCEVYLEEEEMWASVNLIKGTISNNEELQAQATSPVHYVIAYGNWGAVKDVTRRYTTKHWLTLTQKYRVNAEWLDKLMKPYTVMKTAREKLEDERLDDVLMDQEIPNSIQGLKGHPLYCLGKHVRQFEVVHPDATPISFVKTLPVYRRADIRVAWPSSRWIRNGKVVRENETPVKTAKFKTSVGLYGEWQVTDYVPPTAENGIVPRNQYGNVELFVSQMLPKGTVHLMLPGLGRIAKKLNIDCAMALTGFDHGSGPSRPRLEGFVVCKEFEEILVDAWEQEFSDTIRKNEIKRYNRVRGNWKRLIKGVIIRRRLEKRYSLDLSGGPGPSSGGGGGGSEDDQKMNEDGNGSGSQGGEGGGGGSSKSS